MKDVRNNSTDEFEPTVSHGNPWLAMWIIGLLGLLVFVGFTYVTARGGDYHELVYEPYVSTNQLGGFLPKDDFARQMALGAKTYDLCVNCHQANGQGNPVQALPLAGSEWVTSEGVNRLIRIPLAGLTGPFKAAGKEMNAAMPALAAQGGMNDEQVAAVLTYIRNSWGNKPAGERIVTPEQVAKIRAELKDRTDPYTMEELLKLPEKVP